MAETMLGQIFTFYSYKGGTGRSMALANVGCVLAQKWARKKVLLIDWDLEAPGLHTFFEKSVPFENPKRFANRLGLIDLFVQMKEMCDKQSLKQEAPEGFFENLDLERYMIKTRIKNLYLMTAGKFDDLYPTRVNTFDWERLFTKNPWLIADFARFLTQKFEYVLIDSRTGFTDISSVCTALMPEKLVVVFTPNHQNLSGVLGLVNKATSYRRKSDDLRPLVVFPLPSRIENAERELQNDWRFGNKHKKIDGYQPQFESLLKKVYDVASINLQDYFDEIQLQYVPRYSYGEEIAILDDRAEDRLSLARSYENFTSTLVTLDSPWEYKHSIAIDNSSVQLANIESVKIGGDIIGGAKFKIYIGGDVDKNSIAESKSRAQRLRIFLSHSAKDKPIVRELYNRLIENDYDVWLDEVRLLPGQDWDREIEKAIELSDAMIVCLSSQSVTKEGYVQRELRYALDLAVEKLEGEILIIPVRLDDCEVPRRISSWHYVDYFPKEQRNLAFHRLKKSLDIRENSLVARTKK
jgi:cellulose biosynthesis protein BcsQ